MTALVPLFDTHTHFDAPEFDCYRSELAKKAIDAGVHRLVLAGYAGAYFKRIFDINDQLTNWSNKGLAPKSDVALGLHPMYEASHVEYDFEQLERAAQQKQMIAIGEIGLDSYLTPQTVLDRQLPFQSLNEIALKTKQRQTFILQLELAKKYDLPVILHIRKQHAEALKILKELKFNNGGIAHAFSGGEQEALQFARLGFKIGITGLVCDPNAKKMHRAIKAAGVKNVVAETDCPDLTPLPARKAGQRTINTPANLPYVVQSISDILELPLQEVQPHLWHNSLMAYRLG